MNALMGRICSLYSVVGGKRSLPGNNICGICFLRNVKSTHHKNTKLPVYILQHPISSLGETIFGAIAIEAVCSFPASPKNIS